MQLTFTSQSEALIQAKVDSGQYSDATEVVEEALQLLDQRDRVARLRAALALGLEQVDRGEVIPWTSNSMDELIREADEEDRLGLPISDDVQP